MLDFLKVTIILLIGNVVYLFIHTMLSHKNLHFDFKEWDLFELLFLASVGCNLKCEFCCEQWKEKNALEDVAINNVLSVWKALWIKLIDINWGEPLLVWASSIKNMTNTFLENWFDVSVSSNSLLLTDDLIAFFKDKLSIFNVSLHAYSNDLNDRIMWMKWITEIVKNNIWKLVSVWIPVHVTCVVINENINEVFDLAKWCSDSWVATLCLNRVFWRWRWSDVLKERQPDSQDLDSLLAWIKNTISSNELHMYINYSHIGQCVLLRPDGSLTWAPKDPRSSQDWLIPIWNALDEDIVKKWNEYEYRLNHYKYCFDKFSLYR